MNIQTTRLQAPSLTSRGATAPEQDHTFGIELDPFGGIKDAFSTGGEYSLQFLLGAAPGIGIETNAEHINIFNLGSSNPTERAAGLIGTAANAIGTGALVFGVGQALAGIGDPSATFTVAGGFLLGSGVASMVGHHAQ
jgi:hypothetical protein